MKKWIAIFLIAIVCCSMVACGESDKAAEKAIVGKWEGTSMTFIFNEDGTGVAPQGDSFAWKYDAETGWYNISYRGLAANFIIETEDDSRFINVEGEKCYYVAE